MDKFAKFYATKFIAMQFRQTLSLAELSSFVVTLVFKLIVLKWVESPDLYH